MAGVGVIQVHVGDQHANADGPTTRDLDWLDGSVMGVWDEFRALLQAVENLCGSPPHPERAVAFGWPQFTLLCRNLAAMRRRGRNVIVPSVGALDDWWDKAETLTAGNPPNKRLLRADYDTFNPAQWGRHTDMARFLYVTLDRDLTREECNTWAGKYTPPVPGDEPQPEHSPKWVHYVRDLVEPGHVQQRRRKADDLAAGTTADVRDPGRIIKVAAGQPDTIIRTRVRRGDGTVILPDRIDADPVRMRRQ